MLPLVCIPFVRSFAPCFVVCSMEEACRSTEQSCNRSIRRFQRGINQRLQVEAERGGIVERRLQQLLQCIVLLLCWGAPLFFALDQSSYTIALAFRFVVSLFNSLFLFLLLTDSHYTYGRLGVKIDTSGNVGLP